MRSTDMLDKIWGLRTRVRDAKTKVLPKNGEDPERRTAGMIWASNVFEDLLAKEAGESVSSKMPVATNEEILDLLEHFHLYIKRGTYVLNPRLADYDPEYATRLKEVILRELDRSIKAFHKKQEGDFVADAILRKINEAIDEKHACACVAERITEER